MKHVIQQLQNEIKSIDSLIKHVGDKKKVTEQRAAELQNEAGEHGNMLATLTDQKAKLNSAVEGIKSL